MPQAPNWIPNLPPVPPQQMHRKLLYLGKCVHQPHRCPSQKCRWNSPSHSTFKINQLLSLSVLPYFSNLATFSLSPLSLHHSTCHPLSPGTASTSSLTSCLHSCSTSTPFPQHSQGIFLKHLICHFPAYNRSVAWSLGKISNSFQWFTRPCTRFPPSFVLLYCPHSQPKLQPQQTYF